jgi:muconate cycloisomerase
VDIALLDVAAQMAQCPVHALLGTKRRDRIPLLGVIGGGDFDDDLEDAAKKKTEGFTAFKIKVAIDTPARDAERTRAICEVLGREGVISSDANQGFSRDEALAYVRAVDGAGLTFFEQPLAADDLGGMADVAAATSIAIGADEGIHGLADICTHHARKAARGVSLKAIKLGGVRALTEAGDLCGQLSMAVNISCKTGESSIACAAALHAACVIPAIDWALTLTHTGLAADVTRNPIPTSGGHVAPLNAIGLGVSVDEDLIARHRVAIAARS